MRVFIARYRDDPVIGAHMKKLEHALPNACWFVLDPNIPPPHQQSRRKATTGDHCTQKDKEKDQVHGHDAMDGPSVYRCYNVEEPKIGLQAAAIEVYLVHIH